MYKLLDACDISGTCILVFISVNVNILIAEECVWKLITGFLYHGSAII